MSGPELAAGVRPGRNDPCWCGSGQKYKKCHLDADARAGGPGATPGRRGLSPGVISPRRAVPASIARPDYAASGRPKALGRDVKTTDELERLRRACRAAARVLRVAGEAVRPGHHHRRPRRDRPRGDGPARRLPQPAQLPRVPEGHLHLGERGDLPRHPGQPAARGRRHRQPRHHRLPGRHARRLLGHLPGGRGGPRGAPPRAGGARVPVEGHRGGAAGPARLGHRQGHRGARLAPRLRGGPRLLRPRHRRDLPHLAPDPAPLRSVGEAA